MEKIELLFGDMLKKIEGNLQTDKIYQEGMKDIEVFKISWDICGVEGYQIFQKDDYSFKIGEKLDDPDVNIEVKNKELAIRFLKGDYIEIDLKYIGRGKFELNHKIGWREFDSEKGRQRVRETEPFVVTQFYKTRGTYSPMMLPILPMFKNMYKKEEVDKNQYGSYIPINQSLGSFENQVLPAKIFKYFIDKASHIVVRDCGCREEYKCKDHDISLGCMYMGDDVLQVIDPEPLNGVRVVTKEEAMDHVKLALENGLIPVLGRAVVELEGFGKEDTGHNLSCCFCCTCCCINGKLIMAGSGNDPQLIKRLEGLIVEVDQEKCVGCGECIEVCVFKGMEMIDGKAKVNDTFCLGCGRCAEICPNDAIRIEIDDENRLYEQIGKIERFVDVEKQVTKT